MLLLQNLSYTHPNKDLLFANINLAVGTHSKIALIGNNGAGKSTLLKIIAGILQPSEGDIQAEATPYYVPQIFGQFNEFSIARALRIEDKLKALGAILSGDVSEQNLQTLNDDWMIEDRCAEAMDYWGLNGFDLTQKMKTLSGGEKTKVFLAGLSIHQPQIILLDEPSNHLDIKGRERLYDFIRSTPATLMVVSHDRKLLNLLHRVCVLTNRGISVYGGNFDFYKEQQAIERAALGQDVRDKEKALRKAKETERETAERQQKLDARGKKKQEKAGLPTISMNTLRNKAEKSTARSKGVHAEKTESIAEELNVLRAALPDTGKMKFGFDDSALHKGKVLVTAKEVNHGYGNYLLWKQNLSFQITSGERIALKGLNGSGKTTLMRIILGEIEPDAGTVYRANNKVVYIDQDYSLIHNERTVYEQANKFNQSAFQEHEIKTRLTRFLFTKEDWDKRCNDLSGGEKMRLMLCCLTISNKAPDIIILDEPTNNLDIPNIEMLTAAINEYKGTLIVVSHDQYFLDEIKVERVIDLK